jgi:hypothetical protein
MEHKIGVLALSQLNEQGRARESRAVEQDMDCGIYLDKPDNGTRLGTNTAIKLKIRQRFGASSDGDTRLLYNLTFGYWHDGETR